MKSESLTHIHTTIAEIVGEIAGTTRTSSSCLVLDYVHVVNFHIIIIISTRCNIYISRLCYDVSVRLSVHMSVTEVHWHIIANLGFKLQSHFTVHCGRHGMAAVLLAVLLAASVLLAGGSSRAMRLLLL